MGLALCAAGTASAAEIIPIFKTSIFGGQYFLFGSNANLAGNGTLVTAPVIEFDDRWSLIPLYTGDFRGTKGVGDGVGAGTLFQQQMNHRLSATGVYKVPGSAWRLKPSLSYKRQFLNETNDEKWFYGLFDYEKISIGAEAENVYKEPFSYRVGFDAYRIRFPNYNSLESQSGVDPSGNPLGRELSSRRVLDTYNYRVSMSGSLPYPYEDPVVALSASFSSLYQEYKDQRLVNAQGQFTEKKPYGRQDFQQNLSLSVGYPQQVRIAGKKFRMNYGLGISGSHNGSNQNTYDATNTRFVYDSYSYYSYGFGPSWALSWGDIKRPAGASLSMGYQRTQYTGRLVQTPDGLYGSAYQHQDKYTASLGYSYPIAPGFTIVSKANLYWATSNNKFEKNYLYTYRTANYTMGFTYEY